MEFIRTKKEPAILFDGACNLCSGLIRGIQKIDKKHIFRLISLQSQSGEELLHMYKLSDSAFDSIVYVENGTVYQKSRAIFRIIEKTGGLWKILLIFKLLPNRINDYLYDLVARNRYKLFGRKKECLILE
jgi:predicted DCC family thiol-disulfide oxidoreductase YuxK